MGTVVLTNASVLVGTSDFSDHVTSCKITLTPDMLEDSTMGAGFHTFKPGLKSGKLEVTFVQDRAAGKIDEVLYPLVGSTTTYTVTAYANGTSVAATNPKWVVSNAQLSGDYQGIGGTIGELEKTTVTWVPGFGGTLTRSTS